MLLLGSLEDVKERIKKKEICKTDMDNKLVEERLNHRFKLLDEIDSELKKQYKDFGVKLDDNEKNFDVEIKKIRKDVDEISSQVDSIVQIIFNIGNVLKDKLSKKEFDIFKEEAEKWNVEDFVHKNELEKMWRTYSK